MNVTNDALTYTNENVGQGYRSNTLKIWPAIELMISMANQLFPMAQRAFYSFLCCKTGRRRCMSSCHVFSSEMLEVIIVGNVN